MKITQFTGTSRRFRSSSGSEISSVSDSESSVRERERRQMQDAVRFEHHAPRAAYGQSTGQATVSLH